MTYVIAPPLFVMYNRRIVLPVHQHTTIIMHQDSHTPLVNPDCPLLVVYHFVERPGFLYSASSSTNNPPAYSSFLSEPKTVTSSGGIVYGGRVTYVVSIGQTYLRVVILGMS